MTVYRMSGGSVSALHDLMLDVTPSQKCHSNLGLILNAYGGTGVLITGWMEKKIICGKNPLYREVY